MIRREFLKSVASLASLAGLWLHLPKCLGLSPSPSPRPYVHPILGKYLSHGVRRVVEYYQLPMVGPYRRFVNFPIEVVLTVRFETGSIQFVNFNCSEDLAERMRRMGPHELLGRWENDDTLLFTDRVSCVAELYPEKPTTPPTKPAKFFVSGVTFDPAIPVASIQGRPGPSGLRVIG